MAYPDVATPLRTAIINASISGLGTDIFFRQAPASVTRPYVVFYQVVYLAGNQTPRDTLVTTWAVESVGATEASAYNIHTAIQDALDGSSLTITGWTNYWLVFDRQQYFVDTIEGEQYHRYVGEYQIRASAD